MSQQQGGGHPNAALMQQQSHHQRKRSFLNGMANLMLQRGLPLPPNLTGIPYPQGYDPSNSPWRSLDVNTNDLGTVRLAGKDVDLFKLWALVQQLGGGQKVRYIHMLSGSAMNRLCSCRCYPRGCGDSFSHSLTCRSISRSLTASNKTPL